MAASSISRRDFGSRREATIDLSRIISPQLVSSSNLPAIPQPQLVISHVTRLLMVGAEPWSLRMQLALGQLTGTPSLPDSCTEAAFSRPRTKGKRDAA